MPEENIPDDVEQALRHEAEALFQKDFGAIVHATAYKLTPEQRREAVAVIANTKSEQAASLVREAMVHLKVPSDQQPRIGSEVVHLMQPMKVWRSHFPRHRIPIPKNWSEPLENGRIRLFFILEKGCYSSVWPLPPDGGPGGTT